MTTNKSRDNNIRETVYSYDSWWHCIDFGDNVISPGAKGKKNPPDGLNLLLNEAKSWFPKDFFVDKRTLDFGAWDGFFSFYAEQHGASEVVAVDGYAWKIPHKGTTRKIGFDIAKKLLKSNVQDFVLTIPEMNTTILGQFDSIIFAGVFYHLPNPYEAIQLIDSLLKKGGRVMIESAITNLHSDKPLLEFHPKDSLNGDSSNYWTPNPLCIKFLFDEIGNYALEKEEIFTSSRCAMVFKKR
jgi:tRNA (mo5U34)-methyltransferase